jgi:hypothetical protein
MRNNDESVPIQRLGQLQQQLSAWRKTRKNPQQRIPDEFWQQASELARLLGVCRVSTVLRLNYYGLKRRVNRPAKRLRKECGTALALAGGIPGFVELPLVSAQAHSGSRVELAQPAGSKLVLHLGQDSQAYLASLELVLESFWREGR